MSSPTPPTPPPSGPPPSGPPPSGPPPRRRRSWVVAASTAVVGLVVGVLGTLGVVVATTSGEGDDLDHACAVVDTVDSDYFESPDGSADLTQVYRVGAAGQLFIAANGGEQEGGEVADIGTALLDGTAYNDPERIAEAVDAAEDYCEDR